MTTRTPRTPLITPKYPSGTPGTLTNSAENVFLHWHEHETEERFWKKKSDGAQKDPDGGCDEPHPDLKTLLAGFGILIWFKLDFLHWISGSDDKTNKQPTALQSNLSRTLMTTASSLPPGLTPLPSLISSWAAAAHQLSDFRQTKRVVNSPSGNLCGFRRGARRTGDRHREVHLEARHKLITCGLNRGAPPPAAHAPSLRCLLLPSRTARKLPLPWSGGRFQPAF